MVKHGHHQSLQISEQSGTFYMHSQHERTPELA